MTNDFVAHVDAAVRAVCPVVGVSIGQWDDASTWRIDYDPVATDAQRVAAAAALASLDLSQPVRSHLRRRIDEDAERIRLRYITPGVGMAMTYAEKKDQAVAVLAMGEAAANALVAHGAAEFPTLSASVPIEAPSLYASAQLVISRYEAWAAISRGIELTRLAAKKAISDASDAAAAQAAYEAITWPSP